MYPEIHYKRDGQQITVCGCYGQDPEVRLPDRIEGLQVTAIAAYAFAQTEEEKGLSVFRDDACFRTEKEERLCGGRVTSVALPDWTERIGNYAFYRCFRLKELEFTDSLVDIGGGAFTGCQLERIRISCRNSQKTCLKQILEEQRFLLDVRIRYESPDGKTQTAHLIFPEHYEEAVEIHLQGSYLRSTMVPEEITGSVSTTEKSVMRNMTRCLRRQKSRRQRRRL